MDPNRPQGAEIRGNKDIRIEVAPHMTLEELKAAIKSAERGLAVAVDQMPVELMM